MTTIRERFEAVHFHGPGFDLIRLAAASLVLVHHSLEVAYDPVAVDPIHKFSHGYIHMGIGAVAVFFAISGFLVTPGLARKRNVVDFATRRILRIYPALIAIVLVLMFVLGPIVTRLPLRDYFANPATWGYARNMIPVTQITLPGVVLADGVPGKVDGSLWTLFYEVLCYFSLGIAALVGLLRAPQAFFAVFLASFAIAGAIDLGFIHAGSALTQLVVFNSLFLYFAAGASIYLLGARIPWGPLWAAGALALMILALGIGAGALIVPPLLAYLTVSLGLARLPLTKLLENHDLSYGVYLIHGPVILCLRLALPHLTQWWLVALMAFPITLALALMSWKFIEHPVLARKSRIAAGVDTAARRLSAVVPVFGWLLGPVGAATKLGGRPAKGE